MVFKGLLKNTRPLSSRYETSDDEEEFKLPDIVSLVIMIVMNLLLQVRIQLSGTSEL
jgi:hypothetical protein